MEEKNVYQKLQQARVDLQDMQLKKSGKNQGISYYELADILPAVNALCLKTGLTTQFSIVCDNQVEKAILTVYNASRPSEKIVFLMPTAEVDLPRGQKIQSLGAKDTYMRRYMLMNAFEIVESDRVDAINMELTDELTDEDAGKIKTAGSFEELTKVCGELKKTYKVSLITPLYNARKVELEQSEAK